jgi:peptidoglycan hydrolase-like protein with peptidoglycan-binding domain
MSIGRSEPRGINPYGSGRPGAADSTGAPEPDPGGALLGSSELSGDATLEAVARGEKSLSRGAKGPAVKTLQEALVYAGWGLGADGSFGPKTEAGLKGFQKSVGLAETGKLDADTIRALDSTLKANALASDNPYDDPPASIDTVVAARPAPAPATNDQQLDSLLSLRSARRTGRTGDEYSRPPAPAPPPLGYSTGPDGMNRLIVETQDGRRINLLPSFADMQAIVGGSGPGRPVTRPQPQPPRRNPEEDFKALMQGVPAGVQAQPWTANFDDYFRARAAVSEVPTALAGAALKPLADGTYKVVDAIPAPIRRPFDRAAGILLDNLVSAPANLLTSRIPIPAGQMPDQVNLNLKPYPQIKNSCGETMIATWLKGQGVPVALGEVDTQMPFFDGSNLLEDAELRNRGFSLISGPGTFDDMKAYLAHGYPVMVSVGWENGGGHYATVTGYDEKTKELIIDSYDADGKVARVPYQKFQEDWARHKNMMMVAHPQRDQRLKALRDAGRLSRKAEVQEGLSLSDIWVTQRMQFFVEAAYRYKGTKDDLTVRMNVTTSEWERGAANALGGSVEYTHKFGPETSVHVYAEKLATKKTPDIENVDDLMKNVALYVGVRHKEFSARAGYDRGAFQAQVQAELNRRLFSMGAEARVNVQPDGNYAVFLGVAGQF